MAEIKRRIGAIIEARMGSTRLPGKVLKPVLGLPMLEHLVRRIRPSRHLTDIVVATTHLSQDDELEALADRLSVRCYRGEIDDLRSRVLHAAQSVEADIVVKLTGDNPLVEYRLIDAMLEKYLAWPCDLLTNGAMEYSKTWHEKRTFPIGLNIQILSLKLIEESLLLFPDSDLKEHVTLDILNSPEKYLLLPFHADELTPFIHHPEWRLTVDVPEDFQLLTAIFQGLYGEGLIFSLSEVGRFLEGRPDLTAINQHYQQKNPIR
jgi:spore coat polysaccharide biosynthesis protein SpsF